MQQPRSRMPQVWDDAALTAHAQRALEEFVARRLAESDQHYRAQLIAGKRTVGRLLRAVHQLDPERPDASTIRSILRDRQLNRALRYVAGPPVSLDDLGVLVTQRSTRLRARPKKS